MLDLKQWTHSWEFVSILGCITGVIERHSLVDNDIKLHNQLRQHSGL